VIDPAAGGDLLDRDRDQPSAAGDIPTLMAAASALVVNSALLGSGRSALVSSCPALVSAVHAGIAQLDAEAASSTLAVMSSTPASAPCAGGGSAALGSLQRR